MSLRAFARMVPLVAVMLIPAACSDASGNDAPGPAAKIVLVSNPMFTATVGTAVAEPLVVMVTDERDRPVPAAPVRFTVQQGTATLGATSAQTDAQGRAQTTLTLGTLAGTVDVEIAATGVTAAVRVSGIAVPGAQARLLVSPKPVLLTAVGDTMRLVASLADQYGNAIPSSAISWRSLDEAVVTVDGAGLVTGRKAAAATRVIGSTTTGNLADTVNVSVSDPNASVCATAGVSLGVGESTIVDNAVGSCIKASVSSEYVVIPFFTTTASNNQTDELRVTANGIGTFDASWAANRAPSASLIDVLTPKQNTAFEAALRAAERREIMRAAPAIRAAARNRATSGASFSMVPSGKVGDVISMNASATNACSVPNTRGGRIMAITTHAVIVADTLNPAGGFTQTDYERIAAMFDSLVVPVNEAAFGKAGDMDGNQRSVIFYTGAVNELTPPGSGSYVGGFFWGRDLLPKTSCATSNAGEMFYMLVPDPNAALGNTFPKAFVEQVTIGTLAHEYQHLINTSIRLANPLSTTLEEAWLNEGLSHVAEELVFYKAASRQPRGNAGGSLFGTSPFDQAYANYMHQNVARLRQWLISPEQNTVTNVSGDVSLATRGAAWALLRYLADRTSAADGDVWRRLVNTTNAGLPNLQNVFGIDSTTAIRDWTIAMYADDYATNARLEHSFSSWNLRSVYPAFPRSTVTSIQNSSITGVYPIGIRPLTNGQWRSVTLRGASPAYLPFTVNAGGEAQIRVTTGAGFPAPASVVTTIVRVK